VFVPSGHARGPWDPDAMHGGAPAALLVRAIEGVEVPAPMLVARLSMEFLRAVPLVPLTVEAAVVRPGRRLQLVEAVLRAEGEEVCRAQATLLRREAVEVPQGALPVPSLAPPEDAEPITESLDRSTGESFAMTGMEIRVLGGGFSRRGPATAWFRLRRQVVEGEDPSPAQRAVAAGDFGNGIAAEVDFATHLFVNTDLTVHLSREPVGEWIGLDSRTEHGPEGTALARSTLHDALGPCGLAAQSLYVAAR
jgi:Thioesterase-like superfamily